MAAAEARAAWQRVNRYFVQEDAKRAPKLASRQSSNTSSKQVDTGPVNSTDSTDHLAIGFMPFNRTPPYSNLPPDAKWWLQMEPNYVHHRGLNTNHFSDRKINVESSPTFTMESPPKVEAAVVIEDSMHSLKNEDLESFLDVKKHSELTSEELNLGDSKVDQDSLDVKNMTDYYDLMEMELVGGSVFKQSTDFSSSADSSWVGGEKVPWWRVTDGEELASFVAHKSLLHIENCDLPPPQKMKVRRESCKRTSFMGQEEIFMASVECETQSEAMYSPSSGGSQEKHWSSVKELPRDVNVATETLRSCNHDTPDKGIFPEKDPSKAKLLEALCHSQTRAREAERAAQQAYTEKEHILKLFFKQASQLFAYKQWYKLLQLENILAQTGNNSSSPSTVFPDHIPLLPKKPQKSRKNWQKSSRGKRRKRGSQENDIGKFAVVFAVGFTLVGAGLILGWTVGWLLPTF
ncbi:uncharacterized protein LOC141586170 [Silene latifolia]|uniref:uncharacterized protein LOC141586170 n=1 Tax=Silene latifolia TaxID=37657 RepID=UPI003D76DFC2